MATQNERALEPEANPVVRLVRRLIPVTDDYHGQKFFVRAASRRSATPLFVVLVLIEVTDLVFAVDSIPAIFAVTQNSFLVYTSNVFAILGLRSLYFLLADVIDRFHFLKLGLAAVLALRWLENVARRRRRTFRLSLPSQSSRCCWVRRLRPPGYSRVKRRRRVRTRAHPWKKSVNRAVFLERRLP